MKWCDFCWAYGGVLPHGVAASYIRYADKTVRFVRATLDSHMSSVGLQIITGTGCRLLVSYMPTNHTCANKDDDWRCCLMMLSTDMHPFCMFSARPRSVHEPQIPTCVRARSLLVLSGKLFVHLRGVHVGACMFVCGAQLQQLHGCVPGLPLRPLRQPVRGPPLQRLDLMPQAALLHLDDALDT